MEYSLQPERADSPSEPGLSPKAPVAAATVPQTVRHVRPGGAPIASVDLLLSRGGVVPPSQPEERRETSLASVAATCDTLKLELAKVQRSLGVLVDAQMNRSDAWVQKHPSVHDGKCSLSSRRRTIQAVGAVARLKVRNDTTEAGSDRKNRRVSMPECCGEKAKDEPAHLERTDSADRVDEVKDDDDDDEENDDEDEDEDVRKSEQVEDYTFRVNSDGSMFKAQERRNGLIDPEGRFCQRWELLLLSTLVYIAVWAPIATCFDHETSSSHKAWDVVVELIFLLDMLVSMRTSFYDSAKVLVTDKRLVRRNYLRGWFVPDLLSSFPTQLVSLFVDDAGSSKLSEISWLKVVRLLKLVRLRKLFSLHKLSRTIASTGVVRPGVVRLLRLLVAYFLTTHLVACFYWALAKQVVLECNANLMTVDDGQRPWSACREYVETRSWPYQYGVAFYWALSVMMGNESYPVRETDRVFTSATLVLGMLVGSFVLGSCASLLANLDQSAVQKQQRFDAINENLAYNKVDGVLAGKVRSYYDYLFACGHHINEGDLFRELPEKLRLQLAMHKKKPLIRGVAMFQNVSAQCTVAIVESLVPVIMLPREYVVVQGQRGHEMFFVSRGVLQVTQFIDLNETPIRQLNDGDHFGEIALLNADKRRTANVVTISFSELQMLSRRQFNRVQKRHAEFKAIVHQHRHQSLSDKGADAIGIRKRGASRVQLKVERMVSQVSARVSDRMRVSFGTTSTESGCEDAPNSPRGDRRSSLERGTVLARQCSRKLSKHATSVTNKVTRRSISPAPEAFKWTAESAGAQAVRKSTGDEVFEEANRFVQFTKRAAGSLRRGSMLTRHDSMRFDPARNGRRMSNGSTWSSMRSTIDPLGRRLSSRRTSDSSMVCGHMPRGCDRVSEDRYVEPGYEIGCTHHGDPHHLSMHAGATTSPCETPPQCNSPGWRTPRAGFDFMFGGEDGGVASSSAEPGAQRVCVMDVDAQGREQNITPPLSRGAGAGAA